MVNMQQAEALIAELQELVADHANTIKEKDRQIEELKQLLDDTHNRIYDL